MVMNVIKDSLLKLVLLLSVVFLVSCEEYLPYDISKIPSYNGYEYVDLGLPSGLKWATCNVGASAPEEYGGYYAWGETEEKNNNSWDTYKWGNYYDYSLTKYCTENVYGIFDNKTVLDPEDDVAHVKWGGSWRMPTATEQVELGEECNWEWTTLNDVNGYKVTGPNGNSIFLPAAGYCIGTGIYYTGSDGHYWSSSLSFSSESAYYARFYGDVYKFNYSSRFYGYSVRPVSK